MCICYRRLYCCCCCCRWCCYRLLHWGFRTDVICSFFHQHFISFSFFRISQCKSAIAHRMLNTVLFFIVKFAAKSMPYAICEMSVCIEKTITVRGYNIASIHIQIIWCRFICMCVNLINSCEIWTNTVYGDSRPVVCAWCFNQIEGKNNENFYRLQAMHCSSQREIGKFNCIQITQVINRYAPYGRVTLQCIQMQILCDFFAMTH